jgi:hypothetical protein
MLCITAVYNTQPYNYIFFKQVLSFDEVMIKNDPVDEVSTDSDCVLPEATVKHETEDPVGI